MVMKVLVGGRSNGKMEKEKERAVEIIRVSCILSPGFM